MPKHTSRGRRTVSRRQFPVGWLLLAVTALLLTGHQPDSGPVAVAQSTVDCLPGDSRVACENRQTEGVAPPSVWDVAGAGDTTIQGFATDISVPRGGTVHFKVDSPDAAYRMRIYRLGYYGGQGARQMASIPAEEIGQPTPPPLPAQDQPDCLVATDGSGLVDCGNWAETASWDVPTSAVSGIYIARLEREDTDGASHIVFIVRDDQANGTPGQSDLLFQTSDTTWQAYNRYGGNSLYTGGPGTGPNRAYKVSYNRPFTTREDTPEDWLFDAEYPMVRWIERNGFDVSYVTGIDTDRRGAQLFATPLRHKTFLSVGHDEYWSGAQRTNVTGARNAGMHLAFFSGNEVFWKTRWEDSISAGATPYRTLVSYKETHAGEKIDPAASIWTGTWRDNRAINPQGSAPENSLTGQLFTANDSGNDFAMKVPQTDGLLRLWRNTMVAELAQGDTATLAPGTIGYEWDSDIDNGARPAGLFRMSSTTINVPVLVDQGSTYEAGTATHSLTMYRHSSNALVFGAGTIQWSWGLDGHHDRGAPGDRTLPCTELACPGDARMQQATLNLFADMGVQPVTLQGNLVPATASTDAVPPASLITFPAPNANLQTGVPVIITGTASDNGGHVAGVEISVDGGATWHPASGRENWIYNWTPTAAGNVTIKSRAVDDSGRLETPSAGVTVHALTETIPPSILAFEPASGAFGVALDTRVVAHFTEPMNPVSISGVTVELRTPFGALVTATVTYEAADAKAVLRPSPPLAPSTTYTARVKGGSSGVKDASGNPMVADVTWTFTTGAPLGGSPLTGPGGPVLVITSTANKFTTYYAEILRTEGLNAFAVADIASVNAAMLANYDVVILGETTLSAAQVTMFTNWVTAGGNFVAMRPDKQLYPLLGLSDTPGTTLGDGYILINTAAGPGAGLVNETIQFHGVADLASLNIASGAASLATLYSTDAAATTSPAVTLRSVGSQGGQAAAFLFDLARSIVYTRQGNPAWNGQERDNQFPIRSDDLFYGASVSDPKPDYINLNKVAIPQADEQQRLLANLVLQVNADRKPLPRFWYFPRGEKAVVIMTGDDHANGGTRGRFDQYKSFGPPGCSVTDWECVRSTSYVFPGGAGGYPPGQAAAYEADGFEIALHTNPGGDNTMLCGEWTAANLPTVYNSQLADFAAAFPELTPPVTNRTHCISWGSWVEQPKTELARGIRLDTNYYFWPDTWVQGRPGMFTGSGMPMRFVDLDGTMLDVFQATSQMTDESAQTYPFTINALLDKAVGPLGYYGAFTANIHTDVPQMGESDAIVASARERGVPVVSARQMLTWLDARNASTFSNISWDGVEDLSFNVSVAAGANGIEAMLPYRTGASVLSHITRDGSVIQTRIERIKGIDYAIFSAQPGAYVAEYPADNDGPVISNVGVTSNGPTSATVTWTTDEASTSVVDYGVSPTALGSNVSDPALRVSHSVTLSGLTAGTTYFFRLTSADEAGNSSSSTGELSFTTSSLTLVDTTVAHFTAGTPGTGAYLSETVDGEVMLTPDLATEFSGTALPSGWEAVNWQSGGIATVSGGVLTVDGARVNPTALYGPGRSVEFTATFSTDSFQHSGWGVTFDNVPFAIFSTLNGNGQLWARTYSAVGNIDQQLTGILVGVPHRFRIDWNGSNVQYFVDGSIVATHAFDPAVTSLRPIAASDFNFCCGNIQVNWVRMGPYPSTATFLSRIFDAGDPSAAWGALNWNALTPAGTSIAMSVRAGNTPAPDATWTGFAPIAASGDSMNLAARYVQYKAVLSTTDPQRSPELHEVVLGYSANAGPTAADDAYSTLQNQVLTVPAPGVLGNDADANSDPITAQLVSAPAHGTLALNPNGGFTYTPQAGFSGTDAFQYRAHDGVLQSNVAAVTLTVISVNEAPVANGDSYSTPEDAALTVSAPGVLDNDTDANGDELTAAVEQPPLHGSLSLNADGSFLYTPEANYVGADSFTYTASDGDLESNVATVSITVTAVNDPPQAVDDSYSVAEDGTLTVAAPGVLGNDSDGDGDALTASVATGVAHGVLNLTANGSFTYTPDADFSGSDSFTYSVSDGTASRTASVTITVTSVNDAPVAVDDSYTVDEDSPLSVPAPGVLANDSDSDNGSLTASVVTAPASGTLVLAPNGSFVYTPAAEFSGNMSFTYRASDGSANSNVATVTISVSSVNDAPVAANQSVTTAEDTAAAITLGATDVDEDPLTFTIVSGPAHGTLSGTGAARTYTPAADFNGSDSFTFKANDDSVDSNVATVTITVTAVSDAPVADNQSVTTAEDTAAAITLAARDADGDTLTYAIVSGPAHGSLSGTGANRTYTPAANYHGPDSFTFKANDGTADSNVATVSITVSSVNDAPVANAQSITTAEDTAASITLTASDADSDPLTFTMVAGPTHGTLSGTGADRTYTPAANYSGPDSFTFKVNDGTTDSNTATVSITVSAVNDAPSAVNDSYSVNEDAVLTIAAPGVLGNDSDVEGASLTAVLGVGPAHGILALSANGGFTYTPAANYSGPDTFTYRATDGTSESALATVAITVTGVNDAPVAVNDSYTTNEDTPLSIVAPGVLGNDTDADGDSLTAAVVAAPAKGSVTLNANGSFTYTPNANATGASFTELTVIVTVATFESVVSSFAL